jgi:hypothetical protein
MFSLSGLVSIAPEERTKIKKGKESLEYSEKGGEFFVSHVGVYLYLITLSSRPGEIWIRAVREKERL